MSLFEGYERRIDKINEVCKKYGIASIEDARKICNDKGIDPYKTVEDLQPIAFENAKWAYTLGAAIAIKKGCTKAVDAARLSAKASRHSACRAPLPTTAKSVSAMATSAPCSSTRRLVASHSSQAMSPSQQQKAPSASR